MTTYCLADFYYETVTTRNNYDIAAHDVHTTQLCFEIVKDLCVFSAIPSV